MNATAPPQTATTQTHTGRRHARGRRARNRVLGLTAAAAITAGALLGTALGAGAASAATTPGWLMGAGTLAGINAADPAITAQVLNAPTTYGAGSSLTGNPIQPGLAATPVLTYTSYAQFASDIANSRISFPYQWVMYDPEKWAQTPLNEQQNPDQYMTLFGQLAHAHGLKVIMAPALDLGYVPGAVTPRLPGEAIGHWYLRANIAGAGRRRRQHRQRPDRVTDHQPAAVRRAVQRRRRPGPRCQPRRPGVRRSLHRQRHRRPDGRRRRVRQPRRLLHRRTRRHRAGGPVRREHARRRPLTAGEHMAPHTPSTPITTSTGPPVHGGPVLMCHRSADGVGAASPAPRETPRPRELPGPRRDLTPARKAATAAGLSSSRQSW